MKLLSLREIGNNSGKFGKVKVEMPPMSPRKWNMVSSHGLVITYIAANPEATLREIARITNMTERAVFQIVRDLETGGLLRKRKSGRQNVYTVLTKELHRYEVYPGLTLSQLARRIADL